LILPAIRPVSYLCVGCNQYDRLTAAGPIEVSDA
jgi:hypothetical protein